MYTIVVSLSETTTIVNNTGLASAMFTLIVHLPHLQIHAFTASLLLLLLSPFTNAVLTPYKGAAHSPMILLTIDGYVDLFLSMLSIKEVLLLEVCI